MGEGGLCGACLEFGTRFNNPDLAYARRFGSTPGCRVTAAEQLLPVLRCVLDDPVVSVVDCPVDYRENLTLVEHLERN